MTLDRGGGARAAGTGFLTLSQKTIYDESLSGGGGGSTERHLGKGDHTPKHGVCFSSGSLSTCTVWLVSGYISKGC